MNTTETNCFSALPWDAIVKIFSFLPPKEVHKMSSVCRLFRSVVSSSDLWSEYVGSNDHSFMNTRPLLRHLSSPHEACDLYNEVQKLRSMSHDLIQSGVSCSSKDSDEQDIDATLKPSVFWSSKGSASPDSDEWLIYRLREPISMVFSVVIEPYRALYQTGTPMYSPQGVSFSFGFTEDTWHYTTPVYPVDPHKPSQTFELTPQFCVGEYVRVNLHGKRETQPADDLYYTVLDRVYIRGALYGAIGKGLLKPALMRFAMKHEQFGHKGSPEELEEAMTKDAEEYAAVVRKRESDCNTYRNLIERKNRREIIIFLSNFKPFDELRNKDSLRMLYSIKGLSRAATRFSSALSSDVGVPLIWEHLCLSVFRGSLNPSESFAFLILSKLYGKEDAADLFTAIYANSLISSLELADFYVRLGMYDFAFDAYSMINHLDKIFKLFIHTKKYREFVDFSVRSLYKPDWDAVIEHAANYGSENQRLKLAFSLIFPGSSIHPPPGAVVPEGVELDELDGLPRDDIVIMNNEVDKFRIVGLPMAPVEVLNRLHIEMPILNLRTDLQQRIFDTLMCVDEHPVEVPPQVSRDDLQRALDEYFESEE